MTLIEENGNLFENTEDYYLIQCISSDFRCGAGIAVQFNFLFNVKNILNSEEYKIQKGHHPSVIQTGRVFNLITKDKYFNKPTYTNFEKSLQLLRYHFIEPLGIKKLATYRLGCTRDKLEWDKVKKILEKVFGDMDIEILVKHMEE